MKLPALYAGGSFTSAGPVPANRIAKWDGASWSALGSGMNGAVWALAVYDDGGGPALYAGGQFTMAGGVPAAKIAKWDGSTWSALGSGTSGGPFPGPGVLCLAVHDDGTGPALYAGGGFTTAGGVAASRIARWDGSSWFALGTGMNGPVSALAVFHELPPSGPRARRHPRSEVDGAGPTLCAGGNFTLAFDSGDSFVAKWGYPGPDVDSPLLSCPSSVFALDEFDGPAGEVVSFSVTASDCRDPAPSILCAPPSGSSFPRGTTFVTCTATDASGNRSTCQFPVTVAPKARRR